MEETPNETSPHFRADKKLGTLLGPICCRIVPDEPPVTYHQAMGTSVSKADHGGGGQFVLVHLSAIPGFNPEHGFYSALSPDEARNFAAGIIEAANLVDGGARG